MYVLGFFFFKDTATTEIYTYGHTLSLHDALPICLRQQGLSKPFLVPAIDDTFSGQTVERIAHRGRTRVHRARQLPRVKPSAWRIGAGHDAHLEVDIDPLHGGARAHAASAPLPLLRWPATWSASSTA